MCPWFWEQTIRRWANGMAPRPWMRTVRRDIFRPAWIISSRCWAGLLPGKKKSLPWKKQFRSFPWIMWPKIRPYLILRNWTGSTGSISAKCLPKRSGNWLCRLWKKPAIWPVMRTVQSWNGWRRSWQPPRPRLITAPRYRKRFPCISAMTLILKTKKPLRCWRKKRRPWLWRRCWKNWKHCRNWTVTRSKLPSRKSRKQTSWKDSRCICRSV